MKEKNNNLELKIYEKLGVKKFKELLIKLIYFLAYPIFILSKIPKEQRKKIFYNSPSNYFMKKGNGLQDLKDFKKMLYLNSSIHVIALIFPIINFNGLFELFFILLNLYCIMLQRYNYIRINQTINKHKLFQENKIKLIKNEIKEKDSLLKEHTYSFGIIGKKQKEKTLDELLENASLERLKQIKILLENMSQQEKLYYYCPNLIYSSTYFEEKNKNYCLRISRSKQ